MPDNLTEVELKAWRGFITTYARVVPRLDEELAAAHGLSLNQYEALLRLNLAPDRAIRMSELARGVFLSPSGITRAVDQLERRGLVERKVCASDRRGFLAVLTPAGRTLLRAASKTHVAGIRAHFLDQLPSGAIEALASVFEDDAAARVSAVS